MYSIYSLLLILYMYTVHSWFSLPSSNEAATSLKKEYETTFRGSSLWKPLEGGRVYVFDPKVPIGPRVSRCFTCVYCIKCFSIHPRILTWNLTIKLRHERAVNKHILFHEQKLSCHWPLYDAYRRTFACHPLLFVSFNTSLNHEALDIKNYHQISSLFQGH